jgi:hypothetical protein
MLELFPHAGTPIGHTTMTRGFAPGRAGNIKILASQRSDRFPNLEREPKQSARYRSVPNQTIDHQADRTQTKLSTNMHIRKHHSR